MCTVSLIRPLVGSTVDWPSGDPLILRMVVNRDELSSRAAARPPLVVRTAAGRAVMPIDPQGGGTWAAATDTGLVFALLNGTPRASQPGSVEPLSRGLVIPRLLECPSIDDVLERVQCLSLGRYLPWRLIVGDGSQVLDLELRSGGKLRHLKSFQPVRLMATSSSTRHAEASERRRHAFREVVAPVDERTQDRFHASVFDDDPAISVLMQRPDARTVSRTTVEVRAGGVTMHYEPLAGGRLAGDRTTLRLECQLTRRGAA
jgi:uncharacterized protein with NRDE domain